MSERGDALDAAATTGSLGAADRQDLARRQPPKPNRWPRTERRQARIDQVLARRQPDLTVVLEDVDDPHNTNAVLRSCDAVGALRAHVVYTAGDAPVGLLARTTSASAAKWVEVVRHDSIVDCYAALRKAGFAIYATALDAASRDLYDLDLRDRVAFVFGNEMRGVSDAARQGADALVAIPMMGMVESLNVSVACAVTLYEAFRQRRAGDDFREPKLADGDLQALRDEWLRR